MQQNIFTAMISEYKPLIRSCFGIIDDEFYVISCSDESLVGKAFSDIEELVSSGDDQVVINRNIAYKPVYNGNKLDFIVFMESTDEDSLRLLNILAITFRSLKQTHDEEFNKAVFMKHLLQDSILPSDIYVRAKELHISTETYRVAYIIKVESEYGEAVYDILYNMFPEKDKDFLVNLDEETIVLVKEFADAGSLKDVDSVAALIQDNVNSEAMCKTKIGIGSCVDTVREIAISYKEAKIAIEVSKVFDTEKDVVNYEHLGIGRLIYQLPTTLCKKFLDEVFRKGSLEKLDDDTINTIQKFFENSLNISETARKLFVHRNTLVYRLDKIQKNTGLDLREFEDAIIFKVAMMVKKYLSANVIKL